MNAVLTYIADRRPEQSAIMTVLHRLITHHPKVSAKISYGLPCYKMKAPLCHLNPLKSGGVEIVFWRARELSNENSLLHFKDRKRMAGISYQHVDEINETALNTVIQEAYLLDETVEHRPTKITK